MSTQPLTEPEGPEERKLSSFRWQSCSVALGLVEAVRRLTELGLSRRDTAELFGLSHQRIQQLRRAG